MKKHYQPSDSNITIALLTMSGGLQDAYTYINRGGVLANAQTGNIVRMGQHLLDGDPKGFFRFFAPVLAFGFGVFLAEEVHTRVHEDSRLEKSPLHWRQIVVAIEFALLLITAFIPHSLDFLANILVSLSCALQVQAFRKVHGFAYASTMCIGNMRSGFESLHDYCVTKDRKFLIKSGEYLFMIFVFATGATLGVYFSRLYDAFGILLSCILLAIAFISMI